MSDRRGGYRKVMTISESTARRRLLRDTELIARRGGLPQPIHERWWSLLEAQRLAAAERAEAERWIAEAERAEATRR